MSRVVAAYLSLLATTSAPTSMSVSRLRTFTALPALTVSAAFSHTAEERSKNLQRVAFVASELARAGAAVIAAPIAPSQDARDAVRDTVLHSAGAGANFFTVHVATPLEHCEATDRRGVYTRARKGEVQGVPGVDVVYEEPSRADLKVDVTQQSVPEIVHSTSPVPHLYRWAQLLMCRIFRHRVAARDELPALDY